MSAPFDWKAFLTNRLQFIGVSGMVAGLLGELGGIYWLFDLPNHFRLQLIVGLAICAIGLLFLRRLRIGVITLIGTLLLSVPISPNSAKPQPPAIPRPIQLLSFNINSANTHYNAVKEFLQESNANVVVLIEVDETWERELHTLKADYPHSKVWSRPDNFGMAIYSRLPFVAANIHLIGEYDLPAIEAIIQTDETKVQVIGVHPLPPTSQRSFQEQNAYLQKISDLIQSRTNAPTILAGDFNLTPASPRFRHFLKRTNLSHASKTPGLRPTWMRHNPIITLPLDHILISEHIASPSNYSILPSLGSDHSPILIH